MLAKAIDASFDLADPATFLQGHPHAIYDRLRATTPVYHHPGSTGRSSFYALTRYAEIEAVSRDQVRFTSTRGFRLPSHRGVALSETIVGSLMRIMLVMAPGEHDAHRALLQPSFMPRAQARIEVIARREVDRLIARLEGRRRVEFVSEVAARVPIKVMCAIVGIPEEDEDRIFEWTNGMVGIDDPECTPSLEDAERNFGEVFEYGRRLAEQRRAAPRDDLMSVVANAMIDGEPIDQPAANGFCATLIAAGNETTRNALTGAVLALGDHPDQQAALAGDPAAVGNAVNELLRYVSPVIQMMRTTTSKVVLGGETIQAGEQVVMYYGAANRDPAVFPDPDRLDLKRANANRHLAFGIGLHRCIGASVAQMELRLLVPALLARWPKLRPAGAPVYLRDNFVSGIKSLEVDLE